MNWNVYKCLQTFSNTHPYTAKKSRYTLLPERKKEKTKSKENETLNCYVHKYLGNRLFAIKLL